MSTREDEQRILHAIECDLRRSDRLLPARFAFVRTRAVLHRRKSRVLLGVEAALVALLLLGALLGLAWLWVPVAGAARTVPLVAASWTTQRPQDAARRAQQPRNPWLP